MKNDHLEELNIVMIQPDTIWENKEENLNHITLQIDKIKEEHPVIDMIVLPEMFSTGFTMNPISLAETMNGATIEWMREIAVELELAICGSLIIEEKEKYYNRFIFIEPGGEISYYDKKHLFAFAGENENYTAGNRQISIGYKGWKINPYVCYDLRFPVWCRNTNEADIMIFVANWPEIRISHWEKLLTARAIENQCYVIGVNRIGTDYNQLKYPGKSTAIDAMGNQLISLNENEAYCLFTINMEALIKTRSGIPFLRDSDKFKLLN